MISYILFITFIIGSCCKVTPEVNNPVENQYPYDLVWQVPLFPQDSQYSITPLNTKFINNTIITSKRKGWSYNEIIMAFDTSGKRLWEWQDYIKQPNHVKVDALYGKDEIFVNTGSNLQIVNLNSGQTVFKNKVPTSIPTSLISYTSGNIYKVFDKSILANTESKLMKLNKEKNNWDEVYSIRMQENDTFDVGLWPPSSWVNDNGDTILVFVDNEDKTINDIYALKVNVYSYNATADTVLWITKHIDHSANAAINVQNPPIIDDDRIYLLCSRAMHCLDKYTGKKLWETRFDETGGALTTNYLLAEDNLIFMSGGILIGINKLSRKIVFRNDVSGTADHFTYYNGKIYFTDGNILIADAKTGSILHNWKTHNYCERTPGEFHNGVAINPEQGVMYVQDRFFLMCIRLPE